MEGLNGLLGEAGPLGFRASLGFEGGMASQAWAIVATKAAATALFIMVCYKVVIKSSSCLPYL